MSQLFDLLVYEANIGKVGDGASDWIRLKVPLAIDSDNDGVEDAIDGFPDDPERWADTDSDDVEDSVDTDIDGDGTTNLRERELGTFPYKTDSDADGIGDPGEIEAGTDPLDPLDS